MKKRRIPWVGLALLAIVGASLLVPRPRYILVGLLRGEHFYRGWPASYWRQEVARWLRKGILVDKDWAGVCPAVLQDGPQAEPVLMDLLYDSDTDVRLEAARVLLDGHRHDGDIAAGMVDLLAKGNREGRRRAADMLERLGPAARQTAPALLALLHHTDADARLGAARALASVGGHDREARDALAGVLTAGDEKARCDAADVLGRYGPAAREAVPALLRARREAWASDSIVYRIDQALWQIDPKAAAQARGH